ncbi:hypothetical protein R3P38DRAFT_3483362 [Favolaschia claudopus]|uniref:eIF3a PCI domain-containing protein n=1 Tax=Favolaschia claudopus TaxID=2862362 RepID=A0AAW0C9E0_9AGAR
MVKKASRPAMMANYYEKLTRIFLMSGNTLYHANEAKGITNLHLHALRSPPSSSPSLTLTRAKSSRLIDPQYIRERSSDVQYGKQTPTSGDPEEMGAGGRRWGLGERNPLGGDVLVVDGGGVDAPSLASASAPPLLAGWRGGGGNGNEDASVQGRRGEGDEMMALDRIPDEDEGRVVCYGRSLPLPYPPSSSAYTHLSFLRVYTFPIRFSAFSACLTRLLLADFESATPLNTVARCRPLWRRRSSSSSVSWSAPTPSRLLIASPSYCPAHAFEGGDDDIVARRCVLQGLRVIFVVVRCGGG